MPVTLVKQLAICQQELKSIWRRIIKSNIFAHLLSNETCKALSTENCCELIDSASTPFSYAHNLEAIHIIWKNPSLNKQQKHVSISIIIYSSFIFKYYFHFTLSFAFILSGVLIFFFFLTFDLVSRCILNFNL